MDFDTRLFEYLAENGVEAEFLDLWHRKAFHQDWLRVYADAFAANGRMRRGVRAEQEYAGTSCIEYHLTPFDFTIPRLTGLASIRSWFTPCVCKGHLLPFGSFASEGLIVAALDLSWTIVHSHEDHAYGGPFFVRRDWT